MQAAKRYRYWCIKKLCRCEVCGLTDTECLDFHHIDPNQKSFGVGHKCGTVSKEALLAEIMKCRVLCGCCHRAEHAKQRDIVSENILSVEEREEVMREAKEVFDFLSRQ